MLVATVISTAVIKFFFIASPVMQGRSCKPGACDQHVDQLDSDEWNDDSPHAINREVIPKQHCSCHRPVLHASQCKWDQGNDDQGIEDDCGQNGRLGRLEMHDVQS